MNNRRLLTVSLLGILLVGGIWRMTLRVPFDAASGRGLMGGQAASGVNIGNGGKIRIASFNIHRCKGRDGRQDTDRVARLLRGVDVVGLNEVYGDIIWDATNQAQILAERLNMAWLFAPTNRRLLSGDFGNALLTRLPVRCWQGIPLPKNRGKTNRLALLVVLEYNGQRVNLLIAHLGHRVDRKKAGDSGNLSDKEQLIRDRDGHVQLDTVICLFLALAEPAILMGDFNAYPHDPLIRRLQDTPGVIDAFTEAGGTNPPDRVDWIFLRGLKCTAAEIVENDASDHPMVWADVVPINTATSR